MSISLILADTHPVIRHGLRASLEREPDVAIVGEAADGLETVRLVERLRPDVLVLDLLLPALSGLDVLAIVSQRSPRTHVVVFSADDGAETIVRALRNGASAYVLKTCELSYLREAVRQAAAGHRFVCPCLPRRPLDIGSEQAADWTDPHDRLTPRERQALQLTAEGHSCAEIAARLCISPRTAEMHRAKALRKLGLRNQAEVIRYALRRGMIPAGN